MRDVSEDRTVTTADPADGEEPTRPGRPARRALGALGGLLATAAALAVAELAAVPVRPEAAPLDAVGTTAIDAAPAPVKEFAVRTFGESDKLALQVGMVAVLALCATGVGMLAVGRPVAAAGAVLVVGAAGAAVAASGRDGAPPDALPSAVGALAAAAVLWVLAARLAGRRPLRKPPRDAGWGSPMDRRGFALTAGAALVGTGAAATLGRRLNSAGDAAAAASRAGVTLPAPVSRAAPVPRGADLGLAGVPPFTTPNSAFYRVDTVLRVPRVDARDWRLRLHGKGVARPVTLGFDELLSRGLIERDTTLTCVSNEVGGPYVGNARWLGVPLAPLLREAGVRPPSKGGPADQLVARSEDGMTLGAPVEDVLDGRDAMLAVGMNGEPLPFAHGFPVRMLVPGLFGYVSACKWLRELELASFDDFDAYWVERDWAREAPVLTQSRIDTPRPLADVAAGPTAVAGVAWAQRRGITRVEVRVDDGPWRRARLAAEDSKDTWRQWVWTWDAAPGSHRLEVRATDGTGETQTADRSGTVPGGATGRHSVVVNVA
ncbi:molybdopterin-dependent oxidoreductase [Streptomyces xiaopingdaonensis]|uniref:molybdopterin-dependent oxidoreductase n=1 Tax=Streptomyces xiaopingdaonensis TaxID=1565415 RepID=UPI0009960C0F|nr:molybdopterin-dependent oxidoreductase [Streptomyces xiaopingdaonensis]